MAHGEEYDDDAIELVDDPEPSWFPGNHLPEDARVVIVLLAVRHAHTVRARVNFLRDLFRD